MDRFALAFWISLVTATTGWGQAFFQMDPSGVPGRFIEPPRSIVQLLRDAQRAASERRYGDAVMTLGDLLSRNQLAGEDELSGQDFFLDADRSESRSGPLTRTLLGDARQLLASLPREAIETYELRYGAQARRKLDEAAETRQWDAVAEVRRRFLHTQAGRDAVALLVQRAVSEGRFVEARRLARQLTDHPWVDASGRMAASILIDSLRSREEDLVATSTPEITVNLNGKPTSRPQGDQYLKWIDEKFASARSVVTGAVVTGTSTAGGAPTYADGENASEVPPSASALGEGQLPMASPRWMVETTASPSQERSLREAQESMTAVGQLPPPSWMPLRVGNQLLMRTTERLVGVDYRTGKRVWQYPWFETSESVETVEPSLDLMPGEDAGLILLKQRVWNDLPYGRMSTDGERVYVLGDLAEMRAASFSPLMGLQGARPADRTSNSLIALDLATEGKLVWRSGQGAGDELELSGAFFLCPPLAVDQALYVLAEISGDIVLLSLDPGTGAERWRQHLLSVESGGIDTDPVRRVAGGSMAFREGLLVCSTGAGAIVALDLLDRSLIWGTTIDRNDAMNQNVIAQREGFMPDQLLKRWAEGSPIIVGDTVYVTPIESDRLFAFDLESGDKRWKELPRTQTESRYLAGVIDGTLILVGGDHVRGVSTESAKTLWKTRAGWLDAGEQICGVGVFGTLDHPTTGQSVSVYFVPTSSNRMIAVATGDGSALAHRSTNFPMGNLVAAAGEIISQSPTYLSVAYGQASLEPLVAAALEANPNDFEMMVRKAQILMEQDRRGEALGWLDRARELRPDDDEVHQFSVEAMLGALREDFAGNIRLLERLEGLIDQPAQRVELAKLQVRGAIERRQGIEAIRRLIDLSSLAAKETTLASSPVALDTEAARQVSLDAWIGARVGEVMRTTEPADLQEIDTIVRAHLERYQSAPTVLAKRLLHQFGSLEGSEALTETLILRLLDLNDYLSIERIILATSAATPETPDRIAPWKKIWLATAYARGGLKQDAGALVDDLHRHVAEVKSDADVSPQWTNGLNRVGLEELTQLVSGWNEPVNWPSHFEARWPEQSDRGESIRGRTLSARRITVADTRRVVGRSFEGWQLVSDETSPVAVRDPLGNLRTIPVDGINRRDESYRQVVFSGGVMVALMPGELIGVNLFELLKGEADPVLWRRPWRTETGGGGFKPRSDASDFGDQVYRYVISSGGNASTPSDLQLGPIVGDTLYVLQGHEVLALDVATAEVKWRNFEAPLGGALVCDGQTLAIVSPGSGMTVLYDCHDGRRISQQPLTDFRVWTSSDHAVLMYRSAAEGKRELALVDPISGERLLEHTFEGLSPTHSVFGRVIHGKYAVTLATDGEVLIWDLEEAREVSRLSIDPIAGLRGLHVMRRHDAIVLLPLGSDRPSSREGATLYTNHNADHIRVDGAITAVDVNTGAIAWQSPLGDLPWGCTLTQSPISPLLLLSRSWSLYLANGSRARTLDVMAVDVRDGKAIQSLDRGVESFNNDIETRLTIQPGQGRVIANIGLLSVDYDFTDKPIEP